MLKKKQIYVISLLNKEEQEEEEMAKKHNITFEEVYSIYNSNPSSFYRSTIYTHKCSTESSNFSLSLSHTH